MTQEISQAPRARPVCGRLRHRATPGLALLCLATSLVALAAPSHGQSLDLSGAVEWDAIGYFKDLPGPKVNSRDQPGFDLSLQGTLSDRVSFVAEVESDYDLSDHSRRATRAEEAYFDLRFEHLDLRLGKQIIVWGKTDSLNPTDNLTPTDYRDILDTDEERLGVSALRARYYLGPWTLEGILIPTFTPSRLPITTSRWFPDFPTKIELPPLPGFSFDTRFEILDPDLPVETLDESQYALKVSGRQGGWDFSFSYFDGWNDLPGFRTEVEVVGRRSLLFKLTPEYHRLEVYGADFATVVGSFGVRGEAAYFDTEDPQGTNDVIDDPYYHYVVGVDRLFTDVFRDQDLLVIVEWSQQIARTDVTYTRQQYDHIFERSLLARLQYSFSEFLNLSLDAAYNVRSDDYLLSPYVEWEIRDGLELEGRLDLLEGDEDSFFGFYRDNRRLQAKVKYSFKIWDWKRHD